MSKASHFLPKHESTRHYSPEGFTDTPVGEGLLRPDQRYKLPSRKKGKTPAFRITDDERARRADTRPLRSRSGPSSRPARP